MQFMTIVQDEVFAQQIEIEQEIISEAYKDFVSKQPPNDNMNLSSF